MSYEMGFPIVGGTCQVDCHGWKSPLTLTQYYHLVDHHLGRMHMCEKDYSAFYTYAKDNDKLLDNTFMNMSDGYNSTYPTFVDAKQAITVGGQLPASDEEAVTGRDFVVVNSTPSVPATINVPPEPFETYDLDTIVVAGFKNDPNDSTPIIVTAYDNEDNIVGQDTDYKMGEDLVITLTTVVVPGGWYDFDITDFSASSGCFWNGSGWEQTSTIDPSVDIDFNGTEVELADEIMVNIDYPYWGGTPGYTASVYVGDPPVLAGSSGYTTTTSATVPYELPLSDLSEIRIINIVPQIIEIVGIKWYSAGTSTLKPFSYITITGPDVTVLAVMLASDTGNRRIFPVFTQAQHSAEEATLVQTHVLEVT